MLKTVERADDVTSMEESSREGQRQHIKWEATGVYAKEDCSIPAGIGKYIPVQTNHEITGEVLTEISDNNYPQISASWDC